MRIKLVSIPLSSFFLASVSLSLMTGCPTASGVATDGGVTDAGQGNAEPEGEIDRENPDWTEESHSNDVDPNYEVVFADDRVRTLTLTFTPEQWALMQADLDTVLASTGGGPGGGAPTDTEVNPIWGEATLTTDGKTWNHIGARYKGNSSLTNAYRTNSNKFPFKLDFDQWEDDYPAVDDQRFYGFKQLNLGSNFDDNSALREKVAADLFRAFGVPAARTTFCEVYLDIGDGPERVGLYTLVEELDDTMVKEQFEDGSGNLYKPDGDAATFAAGSQDFDEYNLKTNEDEADYSDIVALYDALHANNRTSDPDAYKAGLEAVFDVEQYLRYLAVNQTIQNWDTYGLMTHNYFLYNADGRLTWIPWDNNEAFQEGKRGGALPLNLLSVGDDWPLLRYVMDIPEYEETYKENLMEFVGGVFEPSNMSTIYDAHSAVLSGSLVGNEVASHQSAVATLKSHATQRAAAVAAYAGN